jgi:pycsar effector protein
MTEELVRPRVDQAGRAALQQVNELIRFADMKAAAVLAAAGVVASQLWTARGTWAATDPGWARASVLAAGVLVVLSILLALLTLVPRRQEISPDSLHYYRHVARRFGADRDGFIDAWLASIADDEATERAFAAQVWAAHLVADRKFATMRWSIRLLALGIATWALAALT